MPLRYTSARLQSITERIRLLRDKGYDLEKEYADALALIPEREKLSAKNLLHYLAVRRHDIRDLQAELHEMGLSSLGRMEAYVHATLEAVLAALHCLKEGTAEDYTAPPAALDFETGRGLLAEHTAELLGPRPADRAVRIMVTLETNGTMPYEEIRDLVSGGMNLARINCAKDNPELWSVAREHVLRANRELGKTCRIHCDLAGPNPRTGGFLTGVKNRLRVSVGDLILLTAEPNAGRPASAGGSFFSPAVLSCDMPEVLSNVRVGDRVLFDDGRICGEVRETRADGLLIAVTLAYKAPAKIRSDKTINFPDSRLLLPSITAEDRQSLDWIVANADSVGLSFLRHAEDIEQLIGELHARGTNSLGLVLKIETLEAFDDLPRLLLTALRQPTAGVMIARGDLGVEIGFSRMAEVQEEILWLCEAAHLPVIWATQVLEKLAKKGLPARGEVTDAAMSSRAECVMLNKGPHICEAVLFLGDVLRRMGEHQQKKIPTLRRLEVSSLKVANR